MMRNRLLSILAFLLSIAPAAAQTETGALRGVILDPAQAGIPGARVTLRNLASNLTRETLSTTQGYEFLYIPPGTYEVRAKQTGFKESILGPVTIQVNQAVRADLQLAVGAVEDSVTVTAEASLLQVDNPAIGGQLDQKSLVELPGRSLLALFGLSGSVAQLSLTGFGTNNLTSLQPARGGVGANFNFGGYRQTGNYYILDGVSNTNWNINSMILFPAVESLQELRVQVSSSTAAFGQVPGGTVNIVTRSGTNSYHGEAYNYLRNDALDARSYNFNPGILPKAPLRQNQFGFAIGGPVLIPKLYNGKNRTFVFAHYQALIRRSSPLATSSIPSEAARRGELAEYGRPLYDPLNLVNGNRAPFPNAVIPAARLDNVAKKWLTYIPAPSRPGITNNFIGPRRSLGDDRQINLRADHQLTSADYLYGVYHTSAETSSLDHPIGPITGTRTSLNGHVASLSWTRTIRPQFLNNLKAGFNRMRAIDGVYNESTRDIVGELGIEGISRDPLNWGFPNISTGFVNVVTDGSNRPTNQRDNSYQILDDATLTLGRHALTFGAEFRRIQYNYRQANPSRGQIRFTGAFTRGPNPATPAQNTGFELADFLLGTPQQATRLDGAPQAYLRSDYWAGHFGDTIRLTRKLTLTAGLRWDYFAPPTEKRNNYFNLDFSRLPASPTLVRVGTQSSSLPERGVQSNVANFAPRLGLAYQLTPKTVLRTAYGIYFVQEIGAVYYNLVRNGLRTEVNDSSVLTPQLTFQSAFTRPAFSPTPSYSYIDPKIQTPYVQQWSFSLQRELPLRMVLETLYAGAKGTSLFRARSFNTPFQTETGANLSPRPGNIQQNRTFRDLGPITAYETSASSIYHSLQVRLEKRFGFGISSVNSFTWAKSIDDSDIPVLDVYQNSGAQDERNLRAERGLSFFDVRKRLTSAVILESPFGKGKRFLSRGLAGYLAGPWRMSSTLTAQDGYPQNAYNFGSASTLGTTQRANVVAGQKLILSPEERLRLPVTPQRPRPDLQFYNPAVLSQPGAYELGNAGRNIMPTPSSLTVDFAFYRIFALPFESQNISFRADLINALNIVNYGIPISTPWVPNFGILATANSMRNVTLSLKYTF
jgi:hypothetical protein